MIQKKDPAFILIMLLILLLAGCEQNDSSSSAVPSGAMTSFNGCKSFSGSMSRYDPGPHEECVRYTYKRGNILTLEHINAGFNCCPGGLAADIQFDQDRIIIVEREKYETESGCRCNCLFDLEIVLRGVIPGRYHVSIKCSLADPVEFWIDLNHEPFGLVCVERNGYPWAEE